MVPVMVTAMVVLPAVAVLDEPMMVQLATRDSSTTAGVANIRVTRGPNSPSS